MTDVADGNLRARPASKRSFAEAAKWSYIMDGGRQAMTSIVTFILAQELGPNAFGVAALALVYVMFIDMMQRQGLGAALIQRKDLFDTHLDSAFWAVFGVSVAMTAASVGLAGWWAGLNDLPELRNVVIVLSLFVPIRGLVIVQEAVLRRDMDFRSLAIRTNVATMTAGIVAIVLALTGAGVWALVGQQLVNAFVALVMLWGLSAWRPTMTFSKAAFLDLWGFSSRSFIATVAAFVGRRGDTLVIGIFFGATAAGLYYFASRLVTIVTDLAARALQGAALPELSRYQHDMAVFSERAISLIAMSALAAFPLLALLAGGSEDVIALVGTDQWGPASTVLRILAAVGATRALTFMLAPALQALGRPGVVAVLSWINAIVTIGTFSVVGYLLRNDALTDQVVGLAYSSLASSIALLIFYLVPVSRLLGISLAVVGRALLPTVVAACAGFFTTLAVHELVGGLPVLLRLAIEGTAAVVVMAVLLLRFEPVARDIGHKLRDRLSQRSVPSQTTPAT